MSDTTKRILIGVTGSVAAIKTSEIIAKFMAAEECVNFKIEIKIIATEKALHFFNPSELPACVQIHQDSDEWSAWHSRGDPVLHIDIGKWADIMIIAPLDANCLGKIANGICDNFLLCTVRAWDLTKPIYFAPAMNTRMWMHPITKQQIDLLKSWGYREIPCISKTLMCGDQGLGAMATTDDIVSEAIHCLHSQ